MKNQGRNLTVLVVSHNRLDYTQRTMNSLFETVPEANIILLDNNSSEPGFLSYLEMLPYTRSSHKGDLVVLQLVDNLGWGAAVNEGMRQIRAGMPHCQCEKRHDLSSGYLLLSNNDVVYKEGWYDKCLEAYSKHGDIGVLGVWKHTAHGVLENRGDLIVKDQMPAVGWLFKTERFAEIGEVKENGPCNTKGGNGEDVDFCIKAAQKGYKVAGLPEDVADHLDGY